MTDNSWLDDILNETITVKCTECKQHYFFTVSAIDYADWFNGVQRIETVFSNLTPEEKRCINTHICPSCRRKREHKDV